MAGQHRHHGHHNHLAFYIIRGSLRDLVEQITRERFLSTLYQPRIERL
jgi:hypothetical protein